MSKFKLTLYCLVVYANCSILVTTSMLQCSIATQNCFKSHCCTWFKNLLLCLIQYLY